MYVSTGGRAHTARRAVCEVSTEEGEMGQEYKNIVQSKSWKCK